LKVLLNSLFMRTFIIALFHY